MKWKALLLVLFCTIFGCYTFSLCETTDIDDVLIFEENGLCGVMNTEGIVIVAPVYYEIAGFSNGYSCVFAENGEGLIDKSGKLIVPCVFDSVTIPEDGFFVVSYEKEEKCVYEIYTESGQATGWCFDFANGFHDGYARVIFQEDEYLVDTDGSLHSISPYHFAWGDGFSENRLLVEKDGLYGYLDRSLQLIIPTIYNWANSDFVDGVTDCIIGEKRLHIDLFGNVIE